MDEAAGGEVLGRPRDVAEVGPGPVPVLPTQRAPCSRLLKVDVHPRELARGAQVEVIPRGEGETAVIVSARQGLGAA